MTLQSLVFAAMLLSGTASADTYSYECTSLSRTDTTFRALSRTTTLALTNDGPGFGERNKNFFRFGVQNGARKIGLLKAGSAPYSPKGLALTERFLDLQKVDAPIQAMIREKTFITRYVAPNTTVFENYREAEIFDTDLLEGKSGYLIYAQSWNNWSIVAHCERR